MIQFSKFCYFSLILSSWFYFHLCSATFELSRDYAYSKQLVDGYVVRWSIDNERTLHLAIEVNTLGWIGFGIGELDTGSMAGADMVTGFVNSSGGFIKDRWAKATGVEPEEDVCQDWTLLSFSEDSQTGRTLLEMSRMLVPQDTRQDRPILNNGFPTRILGAWGASDTFGKHETKFKHMLYFFADPSEDMIDRVKRETKSRSNIVEWTLTNGDYLIPQKKTTDYHRVCQNLTDIKNEAHVIAFRPQLDTRTNGLIHHMNLFGHQQLDCKGQGKQLYGWTQGRAGPYIIPEEAGFRVGGEPGSTTGFHSVRLSTHYEKPKDLGGLVDNSGVYVIATTKLRKHDAGWIRLADPNLKLNRQKLIPGRSRYVFECKPSCTRDNMLGNITVFRISHHMHGFGRQMYTDVIRRGHNVGNIAATEFYTNINQESIPIKPFTIMPNDRVRVACLYETNGTVTFGHGTDHEMCISNLWYYPAENFVRNNYCELGACGTTRKPGNVADFVTTWGKASKKKACVRRPIGRYVDAESKP